MKKQRKIKPSRSKNLAHDRFLTGCIDIVRSFSLAIGTVQHLTVFWISEQNFDDCLRPCPHGDVQGRVALQVCGRNFCFFLQQQLDQSSVALPYRAKERGVSINCFCFKICEDRNITYFNILGYLPRLII